MCSIAQSTKVWLYFILVAAGGPRYEIYQIDPTNGEILFLTESASYPLYLAASENMLFIVHQDGVLLYDLRKKMVAGKQDEVLSSFLAERMERSVNGAFSILLYPCEEEIFVLTQSGMYSYELYGEEMECIIEGSMYSISDVDKEFVSMAVTEEEERSVFYIYYSDGSLMRYAIDETLSAEPEICLRIYSLYEDGNIRQAVSAFRKKYPELIIKYEVGLNSDYGVTKEDALRNLSTELAAGTGPDILVMDDLPFESYTAKGVLEDLSPIRGEMSKEEYFVSVIDGFATDTGQYVIPLTFAVPVLAGNAERIAEMGKMENLSQLAEVLEKAAGEQEGSVIGFRSAKEALQLFAQSSMGAWMTEEGALNRDAVEEFLIQVKRIYDIQMKDMPEDMQYWEFSGVDWGSGENTLARRYGSYGLSEALSVKLMAFPKQPFYAGYLSSALGDYPLTQGKLNYVEGEYVLMPGQNYGTCLPATLMAMNSASKHKEESKKFLEYIFSSEFQESVSLNGTPVNRNAYLCRQRDPKGNSSRAYGGYAYNALDGNSVYLEIYWPSKEKFVKLDSLLESVSGVNYCDNTIYEAVIEYGQKVMNEGADIKETVDRIEEELEIYLAE